MNLIDRINEEVSIYDLFDIADPPVKYLTRAKPCQISCPFHGQDTHPSARVYPDTNSLRCFYCSKSWNPVTFWAEDNNWYRDNDKLDLGRAIDDLASRYDITVNTFDWQKKFYALQKKDTERNIVSQEERRDLRDYYTWEVSNKLSRMDKSNRLSARNDVLALWLDLEKVSLESETWEEDLKNWYGNAKIKVDVEKP